MSEVSTAKAPLLEVADLRVSFRTDEGTVQAVDGMSLTLHPRHTLCVVGESGSGKSVTGLAILGLNDPRRATVTGSIKLDGRELLGLSETQLNEIRGAEIAMVFQDALTALSPFWTIGNQIAEGYCRHTGASRSAARRRSIDLLGRVGIPEPSRRVDSYPHEFSGGMRQRAMIAMALACDPRILIADEPTSALDVTVQAQVLELLADLQSEFGMAVLLVTHDFGVVSQVADDVLVMNRGKVVERGPTQEVLRRPVDTYTKALLDAVPRLGPGVHHPDRVDAISADVAPLLRVTGLEKHFPLPGGKGLRRHGQVVRAVDGIDLEVRKGETLGLVGESGSGKTTTGRLIARLLEPSAGTILFDGQDITHLAPRALKAYRGRIQMIFQDPYASLNPRHTVAAIVAAPLEVNGIDPPGGRLRRVQELLELVGLSPDHYNRYPHQFSGGQRQRIGIARALALEPELVIADEPVSALDVTVQAQVLSLLEKLQRELGLTYIFVSHDLAVVRNVSHRVAVMNRGKIVETGPVERIYASPEHEYTRTLLNAVPSL
ncbi:MAG: ABC transporter ATP-binding protein [Sporichthyaceae bacterium]